MSHDANQAFCRGAYGDAAALYGKVLLTSLTPSARAVVLCNRAAAYAAMDLNRKALADAEAALAEDPDSLRAILLKGDALGALGRGADATDTWRRGTTVSSGDVLLLAQISERLASHGKGLSAGGATTRPASKDQNAIAAVVAARAQPCSTAPTPPPSVPPAQASQAQAANDAPSAVAFLRSPEKPAEAAPKDRAADASESWVANAEVVAGMQAAMSLMNAGSYTDAAARFGKVLLEMPDNLQALAGRGTALAYAGKLPDAKRDLDKAQRIAPTDLDIMGRRVQVLQAMELHAELTQVVSKMLESSPRNPKALYSRGKAYYSLHNYRRAVADFRVLLRVAQGTSAIYNLLGTSLAAMGRCKEAIKAYESALQHDPSLKEAHINIGQAYRDLAEVDLAESHFSRAVDMNPNFVPSHWRRGLLRHVMGETSLAIADLQDVVRLQPANLEARALLGVALTANGRFTEANREYKRLLHDDPMHPGYHHYVLSQLLHCLLDSPPASHGLDAAVPEEIKLGAAKQLPANSVVVAAGADVLHKTERRGPLPKDLVEVDPATISAEQTAIHDAARVIGKRMQVRLPGFVPNLRLQKQAGLAVLDVAQRVRQAWLQCTLQDAVDLGWRSIYDVAVLWRQLGEPNDNVWWIDGMPRRDFEEGFGSHTPILKGQHETVRYYPQYPRVFKAMKELAAEQWRLDDDQAKKLDRAVDCYQLRQLRGRDDFVISPCFGVVGGKMEGTRLTVQDRPPEGVEVSIRTALTPSRWSTYDTEMQAAWRHLCEVAQKELKDQTGTSPAISDELLDAILRLSFYWYNFMPLSRGSAAVGLAVLMALMLGCGYELTEQAPSGCALDWEAILTPSLADFTAANRQWILKSTRPQQIRADHLQRLSDCFPTYRAMLTALRS